MKINSKLFKTGLVILAVVAVLSTVLCVNVFATNADTKAADTDTQAVESAEEPTEEKSTDGDSFSKGMGLLAAAIVTSLAGIGGGIAVAAGAPAAIAATAEDPKSFGKSIIFVALGESIALYGVVISILILQKV